MTKRGITRVLMLVENCSYPRDVRVRREAESLVAAGFDVTVISPALKDQPQTEVINRVRIYRYKAPREPQSQFGYLLEYAYSLAATLRLALQVAKRDGIDVIHAANPPDLFVLIAALFKPFGVRFIYDQHDIAPEMYRSTFAGKHNRIVYFALRAFERCSHWLADHVVVTNASYREIALKRGRVSPERISIVRNGPDQTQLEHRAEPLAGISRPGITTFAYLGLMGAHDGVDRLIWSLNRLRKDLRRTDFQCLVIGSGEEQERLESLTRILGLDPYVRFTGFIPDPTYIPYILAADVCVDPDPSSEYNDRSTMIKIMDYMTLSKPIVAFDLPETRRSAAGAAIYAKPNDDLDFARALAYLMDHPEECTTMGAIGRCRVEGELSWSSSSENLLRAYDSLSPARKVATALSAPSGAGHGKS